VKGNGHNKIAPIWHEFEISWNNAKIGDMIIHRKTGMWERISKIWESDNNEDIVLTDRNNVCYDNRSNEVMVVRY
jgi:hypothetical protein